LEGKYGYQPLGWVKRALQFGERFWIGDRIIKVPICNLVNGFKVEGESASVVDRQE